jgi:hypothetical protein
VDALLNAPAFFAAFVGFFSPRIGRPSTPTETYLRLMFMTACPQDQRASTNTYPKNASDSPSAARSVFFRSK